MENLLTQAIQPGTDRGSVIRRHQAEIWRYLRLLGASADDADDLMQETFLRALRSGNKTVTAPLSAWLRTVARNLFLDSRRKRRVRAADIAYCDSVDAFLATDQNALVDGRIEAMQECFAQLEGRVRHALELRHRDGVSQARIATELGLRLDGLKAMLRRARSALRDCVTRTHSVSCKHRGESS